MTNRLIAFAAAGLLSLGIGAAPASAQSAGHILRGAGIGAAGGAVAGAVIPGLSVGEGALIGGAGGAIVNTINKGDRRSYKRGRGYDNRRYNNRRRYRH